MFLKQFANKVTGKLSEYKSIAKLQNEFLVNLVYLTALRNYLYRCTTQEKLFIIPQQVRTRSNRNKMILVLDMDQTLIYSRRNQKPPHGNYILSTKNGDTLYIEKRPHVDEFLKALSEIFTLFVYTAGDQEYADEVLDLLDKDKLILKRFYRQSCKRIKGTFLKDLKHLKKISKNKEQMVLVDDNSQSIKRNYPFSVQIKPFEGCQHDKELLKMFETLLKFYEC